MGDNRDLLDEAQARGVITTEQRAQISALAADQRTDNDERLKPVANLNEIFVTVGVVLLLAALHGLTGLILLDMRNAAIVTVGLAWGTALYFDDRKRFRLPVIYACLNAAFMAGVAAKLIATGTIRPIVFTHPPGVSQLPLMTIIMPHIAELGVLAAAAVRFRIPFLMLPLGILFTLIVTEAVRYGTGELPLRLVLGASGLAILAVAVRFDLKDPHRIARWSDFAFWSYIVGSPLFVHSLFLSVLLEQHDKWKDLSMATWLLIASLSACVSLIGLLLNRRALILSTLVYVGFVIFRLLAGIALGAVNLMLLLTLLLIGLYVTALGSRWTQVRHYVMSRLPAWAWLKRLPPYEPVTVSARPSAS